MPVGCACACVHVSVRCCFPRTSCSVGLFGWQHEPSSWGMPLGGGCAMVRRGTCLAMPQQSHRGGKAGLQWTTLDRPHQHWLFVNRLHISAATTWQLLGNSWSYITHMNTRFKTTSSYVAWSHAFSMAPVMVNLQRFGGVFEYALKGEMPMWTKMVLGTPRNKKLFHVVSDMPRSRNERENESPNTEHVEDSGPDPEAYSSFGLVAKRQSHAFVDPELFP